jgi:histidinol-phosphatase (PHP family)
MQAGLSGLTFTEHYDTHPEEAAHCVYDDEKYTRAISELRERFGDSLWIGKGIEVDYQPAALPRIADFLQQHRFDLVLLAVHYCRGEPVFDRRVWQGDDPGSVTRRYLETVLEALAACEKLQRGASPLFDVLAHLDFVKRYSLQFTGSDRLEEQGDLLDEILRACLHTGMTLELNTSPLRKGYPEGMPGMRVIHRYAELGGQMMVLGSDSHRSEEVGSGLRRAARMLQEAGIGQTAVYEKRVCRAEPVATAETE